jgi:hypothetical protein
MKKQQSRDESGAATCGARNKLCVITRNKGKSLASHPGHVQSVFRPRRVKCNYTMRHPPPSVDGLSASAG